MSFTVDRKAFNAAYEKVVAGAKFFEHPSYYHIYRSRYYHTLRRFGEVVQRSGPLRLLEIGGGQISLLCHELFGFDCRVLDISREYAESVERQGIEVRVCDLLRDRVDTETPYDAIVLCEVVEHLLAPLHLVLRPLVRHLHDSGLLFVTTPNFNRLRNCVRILTGRRIACDWFYPERGSGLGHVMEFEHGHLLWQLRQAGLADVNVEYVQLSHSGFTAFASIARTVLSPLMLRRRWRDNLIGYGYRNPESTIDLDDDIHAYLHLPS